MGERGQSVTYYCMTVASGDLLESWWHCVCQLDALGEAAVGESTTTKGRGSQLVECSTGTSGGEGCGMAGQRHPVLSS